MKYSSFRKHSRHTSESRSYLPLLLGSIICLLLLVQVYVSNRLANTGVEVAEIEREIEELVEENEMFRQKTASASSLLTLKERAHHLGFVKPTAPVYLSRDIPVALKY